MLCLGIESTAHTFGVGIFDSSAKKILANVRDIYKAEQGKGIIPGDAAEHHRNVCNNVTEQALKEAAPRGHILDLASGTGIWAEKLAPYAEKLTVVDASLETMAICKERLAGYSAQYIQKDIYQLSPQTPYDFIFFGFWLSHVPFEKFESFWDLIRSWLKPDGKVFFVDSQFNRESSAKDHKLPNESGIVERRLNDGRTFRIIKMFYEPKALYQRLAALGWTGFVRSSGQFFIFGCLTIAY